MKSEIAHIKYPILILLLCIVGFVSCRPRGILTSRQMRSVIVDLHKMDGMLQVSNMQYGYEEAKTIYYAQVLEQHGVTQAQFDSSLVWYTAHPQLFDKIYPKVLAQLEQEREAYIASHAEELNLYPEDRHEPRGESEEVREALSTEQLDSLLWVIENGYPTLWQPLPSPYKGPLVQNLKD